MQQQQSLIIYDQIISFNVQSAQENKPPQPQFEFIFGDSTLRPDRSKDLFDLTNSLIPVQSEGGTQEELVQVLRQLELHTPNEPILFQSQKIKLEAQFQSIKKRIFDIDHAFSEFRRLRSTEKSKLAGLKSVGAEEVRSLRCKTLVQTIRKKIQLMEHKQPSFQQEQLIQIGQNQILQIQQKLKYSNEIQSLKASLNNLGELANRRQNFILNFMKSSRAMDMAQLDSLQQQCDICYNVLQQKIPQFFQNATIQNLEKINKELTRSQQPQKLLELVLFDINEAIQNINLLGERASHSRKQTFSIFQSQNLFKEFKHFVNLNIKRLNQLLAEIMEVSLWLNQVVMSLRLDSSKQGRAKLLKEVQLSRSMKAIPNSKLLIMGIIE